MIYIRHTTDFKFSNSCVTIGKFDGLHLGHQVLLDELKEYESRGLTSIMLTIDFVEKDFPDRKNSNQIYSESERVMMLEKNGPQVMIAYPFTRETMQTDPEVFLKEVLIEKLGAKVIVTGDDFCFGKDRKGNSDFLKAMQEKYDYKAVICDRFKVGEDIVSSSLIREKLKDGDLVTAEKYLNQEYFG